MSYRKGAQFERALAMQLRQAGAYVVRSAGSKGPADLVAWHGGRRALIQAKVGGGASRLEAQRLVAAAKHMGGTAWIVLRGPRGSEAWHLIYPEGLRGVVATRETFLGWLLGQAPVPWQ
jgi:Holliday junction resolvase